MLLLLLQTVPLLAQPAPAPDEAEAALKSAVSFFRNQAAAHGGYVWRYSHDLAKREGEGIVTTNQIWVQPPATPTVGEAYLKAYHATGDRYYLEAAHDTALALLHGQLHSGGWNASIEFDPQSRKKHAYRTDGPPAPKARNHTSLDDDKTQSALRFLMRYDAATDFAVVPLHEAARFALDQLIAAQFPNGAWPQVFSEAPIPGDYPVMPAAYSTNGIYTRVKNYWDLYTLNDNLVRDILDTLLLAHHIYNTDSARQAALKAADFLVLAQMPEPQPGWAQQYDFSMRPAWARKFEPAAITGGESLQVMNSLLDIYEWTGDRRYLKPLPRALAYYESSLLPGGELARFYELGSNRPLYFTRHYDLTYSDHDLPTHYSFKVRANLDGINARYEKLQNRPWKWINPFPHGARPSKPAPPVVRHIIDSLDSRGAWMEEGRLRYHPAEDSNGPIISSSTFAKNVSLLSAYLQDSSSSQANEP